MMIIRIIHIFNGYYAYKLSKYQNNNMSTKYVLENTIQYLLQNKHTMPQINLYCRCI